MSRLFHGQLSLSLRIISELKAHYFRFVNQVLCKISIYLTPVSSSIPLAIICVGVMFKPSNFSDPRFRNLSQKKHMLSTSGL